ncbi:MAG: hypothetical protein KF687_10750 [Cyclobacteriaceae bacterium]|nr:hypothetical protein [Cyclobacteriaceae bacterium]
MDKPLVAENDIDDYQLPETKQLPADLNVLAINEADQAVRPLLDDYLFGKFFEDRAEFFVIQQANATIFGTPVNTAILYYLDGEHCKTKFILEQDISSQLIEEYGNFKIIALDDQSKDILSEQEIVVMENGKKTVNKSLTKVELFWTLKNKVIRLKIDQQNLYEPYVYTEHVLNYDNLYRNLETSI